MRRRPLRHLTFTLGAAITALLIATAALSLVYTPQDPLAMSITGRLQGPSGAHLFGTDQYGRDLLSRVMTGTITSIAVGVIAVGLGAAIGVLIGIASGYVGGWIDEAFMRLVDAKQVRWKDRAHFLGISARLMRRVLVDHARARGYRKRGGGAIYNVRSDIKLGIVGGGKRP